jgi:4-amino-4-deoxychorismate lyase
MTLVATLDGQLVDAERPMVHADDLGLLRGDGVFETTLVVGGIPRDLDEHLARLAVSAAMLDLMPPPEQDWRRGIGAVLAGWNGNAEMVLRLVCSRGREAGGAPTAFVLGGPLNPHIRHEREHGVRTLLLSRGFAGAEVAAMPWLLPGAKSLSYGINMAARRHAESQGADDVIFVGTDGLVLEGPTATVVVARGRTLVTPPLDGILAGVTVRRLFRTAGAVGWQTAVEPLTPVDLRTADGVWLVSGVRLLAPVISIDGHPCSLGAAHAELVGILDVP